MQRVETYGIPSPYPEKTTIYILRFLNLIIYMNTHIHTYIYTQVLTHRYITLNGIILNILIYNMLFI